MASRILQAAPATLTVTLRDQNGTAADAAGTVTVGVTRADGTTLVAAGTATTHGATGVYNLALTAAQTADLDTLTATWTDGGVGGDGSIATTTHHIVGGFMFSIAEARASDSTLTNQTKYPDADILAARLEVEEEAENICDRVFAPRYARLTLNGTGDLELPVGVHDITTVQSVLVYSDASHATLVETFTAGQLAALQICGPYDSVLRRSDWTTFPVGFGNIVVEVLYGFELKPDMKRAALTRLRSRLNMPISGIPDRATSFTSLDGGTYRLDMPGPFKTGIPEVDAAYERYSCRVRGDKPRPASRPLNLDPSRDSLFHRGIR